MKQKKEFIDVIEKYLFDIKEIDKEKRNENKDKKEEEEEV